MTGNGRKGKEIQKGRKKREGKEKSDEMEGKEWKGSGREENQGEWNGSKRSGGEGSESEWRGREWKEKAREGNSSSGSEGVNTTKLYGHAVPRFISWTFDRGPFDAYNHCLKGDTNVFLHGSEEMVMKVMMVLSGVLVLVP